MCLWTPLWFDHQSALSVQQAAIFATLALALALFAWGRLRHDLVALLALFATIVTGLVPGDEAFTGFGHPAVVTVAAVLIIGRALEAAGAVDLLARWVSGAGDRLPVQILVLCTITATASAFMNNVGALAIMMPVAIHLARKSGHPPSAVLMPLSFASLLGGMTTLIGTPPNIIVATLREDVTGQPFGMFDYTPAGVGIAVSGILFITLIGWRLIPRRTGASSREDLFEIEDYITEVRVTADSKLKGMQVGEVPSALETGVQVLGLVRRGRRIHAPDPTEVLKTNDILILEADADELESFLAAGGARLVGGKKFRKDAQGSAEISLAEVVVMGDSPLVGTTAALLRMRSRHGINLLAVARRGTRIRKRLDHVVFRAGDVLLLQGRDHLLQDTIQTLKCLPLAKRSLKMEPGRRLFPALAVFGLSMVAVVSGLLPVQVAFSIAAAAMVLVRLVPLKEVYHSVDWPVIVLLGAMIPVGVAFETSGGAALIANWILAARDQLSPWAMLTVVFLVTMFLSDIINNAATVVLMVPIGAQVASGIGACPDPFLMAVAVGGSCAFLTPIGHQSNTLVMGPGGYRFADYWRMGLPLEILIVVVGVPLILWFWPM